MTAVNSKQSLPKRFISTLQTLNVIPPKKAQPKDDGVSNTTIALTAATILTTLGAGYWVYKHYGNKTIPNITPPPSSGIVENIATFFAAIACFSGISMRYWVPKVCKQAGYDFTQKDDHFFDKEIQTPSKINQLKEEIRNLKNEDPDRQEEIFDSIRNFFATRKPPLNEDQQELIKEFTGFLKLELCTPETNQKFYFIAFYILLDIDEDAALEIAKTCLTTSRNGKHLNLIEIVPFIINLKDENDNTVNLILREAFSKKSKIRSNLIQYCIENTKFSEVVTEEFNNWTPGHNFLNFFDFTSTCAFFKECALLDNQTYDEFQKKLIAGFYSSFKKNENIPQEKFRELVQIANLLLSHNHKMFCDFFVPLQNINKNLYVTLIHHTARALKDHPILKELEIKKYTSNPDLLKNITSAIKRYSEVRDGIINLINQCEEKFDIQLVLRIIELIKNNKLIKNFLDEEPKEFFEKLSSCMIKAFPDIFNKTEEAETINTLYDIYKILSQHNKDEAFRFASMYFSELNKRTKMQAALNVYLPILEDAFNDVKGIELAIFCVNELQNSKELNSEKIKIIIETFLKNHKNNNESMLTLFKECLKSNVLELKQFYIRNLIEHAAQNDENFLFEIAEILKEHKNIKLNEFFNKACMLKLNQDHAIFKEFTIHDVIEKPISASSTPVNNDNFNKPISKKQQRKNKEELKVNQSQNMIENRV